MSRVPFSCPEPLPLCQLPAGSCGRVRSLRGEEGFCARLREMGFGHSTVVTKIAGAGRGPFVCLLNGTRLALNHDAAASILVDPVVRPAA